MPKAARALITLLAATLATAGLSACAYYPMPEDLGKTTTYVVHKEYIPASMRTETSCSGGVPSMCGDEQVLEKQCWRLDLENRTEITNAEARAQYRKSYHRDQVIESAGSVCVFPSEFDKVTVGDRYAPSRVKY